MTLLLMGWLLLAAAADPDWEDVNLGTPMTGRRPQLRSMTGAWKEAAS